MSEDKPKTIHILLVEDDEVDQMAIKRAFRKKKISNPVYIAKDGIEALAILRGEGGYQQLPRPFMVLLDLNMPRMNGIEFLNVIRKDKELRRSIVFVLTTSKAEKDRIMAYDYNVAGYILKSDVGNGFMNAIEMLDYYWRVVKFP